MDVVALSRVSSQLLKGVRANVIKNFPILAWPFSCSYPVYTYRYKCISYDHNGITGRNLAHANCIFKGFQTFASLYHT